ncbi:MAG: ABC transporter permease [Candidatus Bathyarchaeota archaeon]|nr:MAG: ABC transporter permease [Candidatus Bathyarchaeota archaeon]
MREYLLKRIIVSIFILWVVVTLNFVIFQVVSPVSPEDTYLPLDLDIPPEVRDMMRELYGLNDPLHIRYIKYLRNMFTFDFGISFQSRTPVVVEMSRRLPATVLLLGSSMVATILVGTPIGILAASKRGSKTDIATIGAGLFTWGVPVFYIQLLFMLFFSYYFLKIFGVQLFPVRGIYSIPPPGNPIAFMVDVAWHIALPVITLVVGGFGSWALYTRNILLDALTQDYIVTARAKGLTERTVLYRHAFRSTLPPIVTIIALSIPGIITGAMITEWIFTLPGIGRWYLDALNGPDYPVLQAVLFMYAILTIFCNLIADLLYGILDPRIRVGVRR